PPQTGKGRGYLRPALRPRAAAVRPPAPGRRPACDFVRVFALAPDLAATFALARTVVLALAPDLALAPLLVLALALDLAAVFALPAALGRAFAPPNRTAVPPLPFAAALAGLRREPCFFSCSTIALPRSA